MIKFQSLTLREAAQAIRKQAEVDAAAAVAPFLELEQSNKESAEKLASWLEELALLRECIYNARLALAPSQNA